MYALVDVNNMYVSCERVFKPAPHGRPVVVLSNNDGACIARSNEAKDLGVQMAQPWFQVKHLERSAGLIALSANFELYGDMSSRMMSLAAAYAPRQEVYSIDECFLDFEGVPGALYALGRDLRHQVLKWTGLPTSVGFGPIKTLAKLANHLAKMADLSGFAVRVARRLRDQRSVANAVHVFIRTSPHRARDRQHAPSATMPLPRPTADTRLLVVAAVRALLSIYKPGYQYAKAGVMLLELQDDRQEQQASLDLFDEPEQKQFDGRRDLMETIGALNKRFGRDAVSIASAAKCSTHSAHASRQDRCSPRYTTRLDEIVMVRA